EAKDGVERLQEEFFNLKSDAQEYLLEKESQDPKIIRKFQDYLLEMPVAKKRIHIRFFSRNEEEILDAKTIRKLFVILGHYCNYSNYEIIFHVVKKFCHGLKGRMTSYRDSLVAFEKSTTVDIYLCAISARPGGAIMEGFIRMTVKLNKPPSECLLYEIRELKETIQETAALESYAMYIEIPGEGSVRVSLRIHEAVGWMVGVVLLTAEFRQEHLLTEVSAKRGIVVYLVGLMEYLRDELRSGSRRGYLEKVMSLIDAGVNVNVFDLYGHGESALIVAAREGRTEVVSLLLETGANTDLQNMYGDSALMMAARMGRTAVVSLLIEVGANADLQNKNGDSALMLAVKWGRTEVVSLLIEVGANAYLQNKDGDSALMLAVKWGRTEVVSLLLEVGANADLQNKYGNSALTIAVRGGWTEVVSLLLEVGANAYLQNKDGDSVLMMAARKGKAAVVSLLIEVGANADLQNKYGDSALTIAVRGGWTEVVSLLVSLDRQQNKGCELLMLASKGGELKTITVLITAGVNVNHVAEDGYSALMMATREGRTEVVSLLVKAGANTDLQNKNGDSALMMAARMLVLKLCLYC
ncbi:Ankyrin repeat and KH domain-containing protein 1, partial [Geodia barretti]